MEHALIAALFDGVTETPLWDTFLARLRTATGADYATLIFSPPGRRMDEALQMMSGGETTQSLAGFFAAQPQPTPRPPSQIEARPYSLADLVEIYTPEEVVFYRDILASTGITAIRQMRVREKTGVDAWLTIARNGDDFSRDNEVLLRALAPVLRGVLQLYVGMERERFAASLTAQAVRRLQFGWISLDHTGHVIDCDEQGALVLAESGVIAHGPHGKLRAHTRELDREVQAAIESIARAGGGRPRALTLNQDPWLDMLLVPADRGTATQARAAAVIAYVHGDNWHASDRHEQLGELFGLSPREARLALAISRGMSLAEAAAQFGLTISTARTYSKSIYAKTGARGLPDLVRIVLRSVLAISPSD